MGENLIGVVTPFMTSLGNFMWTTLFTLGARNYEWLPYVITR
jgi:hypothetical protein